MIFAEGTEVIYNNVQGVIGFVGDTYLVIQITPKPGSKSPGLLVYRENYKNIQKGCKEIEIVPVFEPSHT